MCCSIFHPCHGVVGISAICSWGCSEFFFASCSPLFGLARRDTRLPRTDMMQQYSSMIYEYDSKACYPKVTHTPMNAMQCRSLPAIVLALSYAVSGECRCGGRPCLCTVFHSVSVYSGYVRVSHRYNCNTEMLLSGAKPVFFLRGMHGRWCATTDCAWQHYG